MQDPQFNKGDDRIRVLQNSLGPALESWIKLIRSTSTKKICDLMGKEGVVEGRRRRRDRTARFGKSLKNACRTTSSSKSCSCGVSRNPEVARMFSPRDTDTWVHSDTLGVIENRGDHAMIVSSACKGHENCVRLLCSWARKRTAGGKLPFTTISPNKNNCGRMHRDAGNIGTSIGLAIGKYKGGKLRHWRGDSEKGRRSSKVKKVRGEPSIALNIKKGVAFDGNCAHEVEPSEGERYSLIFLTVRKFPSSENCKNCFFVYIVRQL